MNKGGIATLEYNYVPDSYELYHHGVKGMKWGVRRYQNADGSLTNAGKKRYGKMSNDKLSKTLKKQVQKQRAEIHGGSNRWMSYSDIGENSKKAIKKFREDGDKYRNSDAYKKAQKQFRDLDKKYEAGKIDSEKYDAEYEKIQKSIYNPKFDTSVRYTNEGRKYAKEYVNGYGKDITVGYLQDLGYNKQVSEEFAKRIINSNRKTIF